MTHYSTLSNARQFYSSRGERWPIPNQSNFEMLNQFNHLFTVSGMVQRYIWYTILREDNQGNNL
jgi:hypothetical protein